MRPNTEAEIRHIYEGWHQAVVARDLEALLALYAETAILETPLILAVQPHREGILRGKAELRPFFAAGFANAKNGSGGNGLGRWYRTGVFFANGRQLTWEYPRATPEGDQVDLVEMMEIEAGLIAQHRVYWGWVGFKALSALAAAR